jgi:hypothetical protein
MKRLLAALIMLAAVGVAVVLTAPAIERLAADARGQLAVVAIGGRDDAANGPAFVACHGPRSPTVLFDEAMTVWDAYAIRAPRLL